MSCSVGHAREGVWGIGRRESHLVACRQDRSDGGLVDLFAGDPRSHCGGSSRFGCHHRGMHASDFGGDISVHDRTSAITVVECFFISRKDVDDHRFAGSQGAMPVIMAIGTDGTACHDCTGIGALALEKPNVDQRSQAFAG